MTMNIGGTPSISEEAKARNESLVSAIVEAWVQMNAAARYTFSIA